MGVNSRLILVSYSSTLYSVECGIRKNAIVFLLENFSCKMFAPVKALLEKFQLTCNFANKR